MNGSKRSRATINRALTRGVRTGLMVGEVARHRVLQSQLLFFESVEKVFVGMGPVLFFFD